MTESICPCGSTLSFSTCCGQLIARATQEYSPEQLMRSRYTAYAIKDYQYIVDTYAKDARQGLTKDMIKGSDQHTLWLKLEVVATPSPSQVEFKAYYSIDNQYFMLHEVSNFIEDTGAWFYQTGDIQSDSGKIKLQRNDPCLCGSGKKAKKCCL